VVIRPADLDDVYEKACRHHAMEEGKFRRIEQGTLDKSWVDKTLSQNNCEII